MKGDDATDKLQPHTKKAKLQQLLQFKSKLPNHSQSVLDAIVKEAKEHGLPEYSSATAASWDHFFNIPVSKPLLELRQPFGMPTTSSSWPSCTTEAGLSPS